MARVMVLLFTVLSLGLVYRAVSGSGEAPAAAAQQADAQLAQIEKGVGAAVQAQQARQRAVAAEITRDPALLAALAKAAGNSDGPGLDDAPALKDALDQALAKLPEADRSYAAAAMATSTGAVAVLPSHEPLAASSFAWLDEALKAGGAGKVADVAGHKVQVFASPVRVLKGDDVQDLGTLAIAYARDGAGFAKLAEAFPGLTFAAGGKVLATSDKAHGDAAAKLTGPGAKALVSGQPDGFMGFKLPMSEATLVEARAFNVPGADGVLAIATADLTKVAAATADGQKSGLEALLAILVLGFAVTAMVGRGAAAAPVADDEDAVLPPRPVAAPAVQAPAEPAFERFPSTPAAPPPPREEATRVVAAPPPLPPEPPRSLPTPPPPAAPPPAPVAVAKSDPVPGFDELFGPSSAPPPKAAPLESTRASMPVAAPAPMPVAAPMASNSYGPAVIALPPTGTPAADPLSFLNNAQPPPQGDVERTGLMSRDVLTALAAQSAAAQQPPPKNGTALFGAISVPEERTSVSAVPADLLRQAARGAGPGAGGASAEEQHFQEVFREFMQTRERCNEPPENLTFEKFSAKLRKNKEQLVQKYACKSVRFQVYVKEGKAALKATPVKDA